MIYKEQPLENIIEQMRAIGDLIVPHNYPRTPPPVMEDDLAFFKEREATVDGYNVILHYQKSDYESHLMETLQVYGKSCPFLPFGLICKLAKKFLGNAHLSLVELFKENRKIYCWSVCVDSRGRPIPSPYDVEVEQCNYEGFQYLYMQPNQVNFF